MSIFSLLLEQVCYSGYTLFLSTSLNFPAFLCCHLALPSFVKNTKDFRNLTQTLVLRISVFILFVLFAMFLSINYRIYIYIKLSIEAIRKLFFLPMKHFLIYVPKLNKLITISLMGISECYLFFHSS